MESGFIYFTVQRTGLIRVVFLPWEGRFSRGLDLQQMEIKTPNFPKEPPKKPL